MHTRKNQFFVSIVRGNVVCEGSQTECESFGGKVLPKHIHEARQRQRSVVDILYVTAHEGLDDEDKQARKEAIDQLQKFPERGLKFYAGIYDQKITRMNGVINDLNWKIRAKGFVPKNHRMMEWLRKDYHQIRKYQDVLGNILDVLETRKAAKAAHEEWVAEQARKVDEAQEELRKRMDPRTRKNGKFTTEEVVKKADVVGILGDEAALKRAFSEAKASNKNALATLEDGRQVAFTRTGNDIIKS